MHRPEPATDLTPREASKATGLPEEAVLVLAYLNPLALGAACGVVLGLCVFLATIILVIRDGPHVGMNLRLLSHYFLGYRVTGPGSLIGFAYGLAAGFFLGYSFAATRNFLIHMYLVHIRRKAEKELTSDLLDHLS